MAFLPEKANRVLEVGCGSGTFGVALRMKYPKAEIFGIEQNQATIGQAESIYDRLCIGDVTKLLSDRSLPTFDLIIFNDVLEHLIDPWLCLTLAHDHMDSSSTVVASIPNMRFWPVLSDLVFQGNWIYRDAGVMDRTHLRFFTRNSIGSLFQDSRFKISRLEGINQTWIKSIRWRVLNLISMGLFSDCLFPQFAIVAHPNKD